MKHLPPHLQRRSFLKLGIGAAVVLAVAGGAVALIKPGLVNGRLSPSARLLMARVGQAMLQGTLPADALEQQRAIDAVLQRTDDFTADHGACPPGLFERLARELTEVRVVGGTVAIRWQRPA